MKHLSPASPAPAALKIKPPVIPSRILPVPLFLERPLFFFQRTLTISLREGRDGTLQYCISLSFRSLLGEVFHC